MSETTVNYPPDATTSVNKDLHLAVDNGTVKNCEKTTSGYKIRYTSLSDCEEYREKIFKSGISLLETSQSKDSHLGDISSMLRTTASLLNIYADKVWARHKELQPMVEQKDVVNS